MNRDEFIRLYVIQFCAAYVATNYNQNCTLGWTDANRDPPMEDAIHLAECAWEKALEHGAKYFEERNDPRMLGG